MALSQDFLLDLKYRNDIESVISPYVNLKRRGSTLVGLCPFHNEKTPSFTVYPEKGNYHCYGCGVGGDVITFIRQIENLEYIEAIRLLANRAGVQMPDEGYNDEATKIKNAVLEINRESALFFHNCLMSDIGENARQYLLGRGLTIATIRHFGLGYAPESWGALLNHLKSKGFKENMIYSADMIGRAKNDHYYDRFRNRVMYPIINLRGNVIGFSGRAMPGDEKAAKYINTGDTLVFKKSHNMYALNFAKSVCSEKVILVEGNMDVVSLHQAGFCNAVAALGTAFTVDQARLLSRYTKEVVVTLDADNAGKKATDRVLQILSQVGLPARILRIPDCKDPDEFIKKNGATRFSALLEGAISDIEYRLFMAADGVDTKADDGLVTYLKKAAQVLATVDDAITVDLYAGRLSDKYDVSKSAIMSAIEQTKKNHKKQQAKKELSKIITPRFSNNDINPERRYRLRAVKAEEAVLTVLMTHPDFFEIAYSRLGENGMVTEWSQKVYSAVCSILQSGQAFDLCLLGENFNSDETGYISMLENAESAGENPKIVLTDSIAVILEEKEKIAMSSKPVGEMSDDEWNQMTEQIKKSKSTK
ncbi:MAG: DNA primase [Oscillospiraceae bacterium]|nr:DNA primase [Oscillospiraceae bacterium]